MYNTNTIQPLVSIVIPSYNKAPLLIEMVQSIIGQTYTNWELIIVDDGSDDINFNLVRDYINRDKRCSLIQRDREPKNGNTCRNIGMEKAEGKYILIFDADDILCDICIEQRVSFMESNLDCDYASFPYAVFNDGSFDKKIVVDKKIEGNNILRYFLKNDYPFTVWSNIYRYDSIKDIKWDERVLVYQDLDFMISGILSGLKYKRGEGEADYYYRQFHTGQNVSGNFVSGKKNESTLYLFDKILSSIGENERSYFRIYIYYQIERMLKGEKYEDIDNFIEMLSPYYNNHMLQRVLEIKNICKRIRFHTIRQIYLHKVLYDESGIKSFRTYFYHELIKAFIPVKKKY